MSEPKKRGRPRKQPVPQTANGYTITKPGDQYVVRLGGNVVYASRYEHDAHEYVRIASGAPA